MTASQQPLFLDSHPDRRLKSPIEHVVGWAGMQGPHRDIRASCNGHDLRMARVDRPDAARAGHPDHFGFSFFIDLPEIVARSHQGFDALPIEIRSDDELLAAFSIAVEPQLVDGARWIHANRAIKADFVRRNVRTDLKNLDGCDAPSALASEWALSPRRDHMTEAVSSHAYGPETRAFLESLGPERWVLDAGAGLRRWPTKNVINMEIYDYPSTDVLAIGQELPFADNTFDGVLSLAVLEHVDDPFLCARELLRVLKPGGKAMIVIPFLQAEHGYPSHFFNATRFGVRKLFETGATLERQFLDFANQPIFTLHQILGQYAHGLSGETREAFLNAPVRTFVENQPTSMHAEAHPFVTGLSDEMRWILAWGTSSIFVKD